MCAQLLEKEMFCIVWETWAIHLGMRCIEVCCSVRSAHRFGMLDAVPAGKPCVMARNTWILLRHHTSCRKVSTVLT